MATKNLLQIPVAPRLPNATPLWTPVFLDEYSRVLRIYFNQLDTVNGAVLGTRGGKYISYPYGAFQRDGDFTFSAANTAALITVGTTDFASGTYYAAGDGIHVQQTGVYNLQYSVQFANTDSQAHTAWLWLRQNGVDLVGTGSKFDIPSTHGTSDGYLIATSNFYVSLVEGGWVELWGATSQAETGALRGVYIEGYVAQTSPFAMPAIPSVVVTLSFVSAVP